MGTLVNFHSWSRPVTSMTARQVVLQLTASECGRIPVERFMLINRTGIKMCVVCLAYNYADFQNEQKYVSW